MEPVGPGGEPAAGDLAGPDEPLALSAPLARRIAATECRADDAGRSCAWYHGFWQYLRLLDFITTPRDHAAFYRQALGPALAEGCGRVLVSGSADYAMLAQLLRIFGEARRHPAIVALDICRTPLALCEWYAARRGVVLATVATDILAYRAETTFDLVCTHSFFGRFAPAERPRLIERWRALLRPGGRVVTVNRIRPDAPAIVGFTAEQAARFVARVRERAATMGRVADLGLAELLPMAEAYAAATRTHPLRSAEELRALFEAGGFRIEHLAVEPLAGRTGILPTGPTMSGGARYAQLVARRL